MAPSRQPIPRPAGDRLVQIAGAESPARRQSFSPLPPGALSERCDRTVQCDGRRRGKHYYQRMKVSVLLPAGLLAAVLLSTIPAHSREQTALTAMSPLRTPATTINCSTAWLGMAIQRM